ncbi:MAG: 50S ribosomal protein L35 [Patescibacteria group bacterium]|nr:50S ribosomal protein L35 [Patescibacteria group bacterium]MDE1966313.1 50S ribosomal protein L35 [Patescibacteria group bacterium]
MKTNKSYTKRIRVTKHGKLIARKPGQNHFNAKQSGSERGAKRRATKLVISNRARRRFFPGA